MIILSDTPRTDAKLIQVWDNETGEIKTLDTVYASFARALEKELAAERAIVNWLGSPEGRRYQTANPDATLYRETILSAMKGARYAD